MSDVGNMIHPAVDLFRRGETHHVLVDLPGLTAEDVRLRVDDGEVVIEADRPSSTASADDVVLSERPVGHVERRFRLPSNADPSTLTADCTHGLLHVAVSAVKPGGPAAGGERQVDVGTGQQRLASADDTQPG